MDLNIYPVHGGPVAAGSLKAAAEKLACTKESAPPRECENLLGDIAERQHHVNMRICAIVDRAEKLATKIFGAVPQRGNEVVDNVEGVLYLIQQTGFQQDNLGRLEDALVRLERL